MEQMTLMQAMQERHSVRSYLDTRVPEEIRGALDACRDSLTNGQDLHIRLVWDDPEGFDSRLAHYGRFRNVRNFMVLSAPRGKDMDEAAGYCGEMLVLRAQQLGLRTCWAALTFNRKAVRRLVPDGDELIIVIAMGYGADNGTEHRSQTEEKLAARSADDPTWYLQGVRAALSAPMPDALSYGETYRARDVAEVVEDAVNAGLLSEEEKTIFSVTAALDKDSPILYYIDDSLLTICWQETVDGHLCTFLRRLSHRSCGVRQRSCRRDGGRVFCPRSGHLRLPAGDTPV